MLALATSRLSSLARMGRASEPGPRLGPRPAEPLVLYEFEGCPWCRRVREALTDLALPAHIKPCPKGGTRFRPESVSRSGMRQFPWLVDPNAGISLHESADIVAHLYEAYGTGAPPRWLLGPGFALTSNLASALTGLRGTVARPSVLPEEELRLRGNETDSQARLVRERLCELELPYLRQAGALRLTDPSAGVTLEETASILDHLERYAA